MSEPIIIDDSLFHAIHLDGETGVFVIDKTESVFVTCYKNGQCITTGGSIPSFSH